MKRPGLIDVESFEGKSYEEILRILVDEINDIKLRQLDDEILRMKNPPLQDAYEQYETIRSLVSKDDE